MALNLLNFKNIKEISVWQLSVYIFSSMENMHLIQKRLMFRMGEKVKLGIGKGEAEDEGRKATIKK